MSIEQCPEPRPNCPYFEQQPPPQLSGSQEHGCYSDTNHIIPKRLGQCALSRAYIQLPSNKEQICRWLHDEINALEASTGDALYGLPDRETMRAAVSRATSVNKRKKAM